MKIGLIDLDRTKFPNLALMKLSAWYRHKRQGDEVIFNMPLDQADITYVACVFTKNENRLPALKSAVLGGTGFNEDNYPALFVWAIIPICNFTVSFL